MDLKKLESILEKGIDKKELMEFFGVKNKKEAISLWKENLKTIKFSWNDEIGYTSLDILYKQIYKDNENIFYQELMKHSLFLNTFCNYDLNLVTAFVNIIGVLEFIYLTRNALKSIPEYVYYIELYEEYKKELRFLSEWKASTDLLETLSRVEDIDMTDLKGVAMTLSELKKSIEDGDK